MNKAVIELQNIKRNFQVGDETVHALRGVSFTIREGEFVTIMGTSGSGKSTLLNTLYIGNNRCRAGIDKNLFSLQFDFFFGKSNLHRIG